MSMPVSAIVNDCTEKELVYVLDPGNSRIKCLSQDGKFVEHLGKYKNLYFNLNYLWISINSSK